MAGAIAHDQAQQLRVALETVVHDAPELPPTALTAFRRLVDVLESSADAVVFPADATVSTQEAAALLGVSRMTVVRLIDREKLTAEGGAVHRRIAVTELARYQADSSRRRRAALTELAADLGTDSPTDQIIRTR